MIRSKEMLISFAGGCLIGLIGWLMGISPWLYYPACAIWGYYMGKVWSARMLREWGEQHEM